MPSVKVCYTYLRHAPIVLLYLQKQLHNQCVTNTRDYLILSVSHRAFCTGCLAQKPRLEEPALPGQTHYRGLVRVPNAVHLYTAPGPFHPVRGGEGETGFLIFPLPSFHSNVSAQLFFEVVRRSSWVFLSDPDPSARE